MPFIPPLITCMPDAQPLYAPVAGGGGGGGQTLSQSGNSVSLSGGGGSVDIASTTLVADTATKTTAMTYDGGLLATSFDGDTFLKRTQVGTAVGPTTFTVFENIDQYGDSAIHQFYTSASVPQGSIGLVSGVNLNIASSGGLTMGTANTGSGNGNIDIIEGQVRMRATEYVGVLDGTDLRLSGGVIDNSLSSGTAGQFLGCGAGGEVVWATPGGGGGGVQSVDSAGAGSNILVDNTDPANPKVSLDINGTVAMNAQNIVSSGALGIQSDISISLDSLQLSLVNLPSASASDILYYDPATKFVTHSTPPNFRPTNQWYVAKNGNDLTGDGSYSNPYLTIQTAINEVEAQSTANLIGVVNISPGHYTEDLTFTNGYIALIGTNGNTQDSNELTEVIGNILINITAGADDKFNKQVMLCNLQCTQSPDVADPLVYDTSTKQHTLFLQNSYLFGRGALLHQNSSVDCVTRMTQVEVNQDSSAGIVGPTLRFSSGSVLMERCDVDTNQDVETMVVDGTAVISRCALCSFESSSATASAKAVVSIQNNLLHTFGNCSFLSVPANWYALESTGFVAPVFPADFGTTGLNLVNNSILLSATGGAGGVAVKNTGYVYKQNNGSFFGSASGYTSPLLVYAYTAM